MKRNFVVACVLVLALALGLSATVGASVQGSAEPAAKKGAKKGKACKAKKAGKGKAGKSAAASAQKKGKGKSKGKGKGCKSKGKGKPAAPQPVPAPAPPPAPPANWPLTDGTYEDPGPNNVALMITGGGTLAEAKFSGDSTCFPLFIGSNPAPVTATATSLQASGTIGVSGGSITGKWSITVTPSLGYELVTDSSYVFPEQTPCNKPGVIFTGTLVKAAI